METQQIIKRISNPDYALGHTPDELQRLMDQSAYYGDLTRDILERAGLGPGMTVLDIGCGAGDVTFLAAHLVGPNGKVFGIDKSPEAIALAEQRAAGAGLENVQFIHADVNDLTLEAALKKPVDALVGRLVLMYFADPAAELERLAHLVRPGGIIAFQEFELMGVRSLPQCTVIEEATDRIRKTFFHLGADIQMGLKLAQTFERAGLPNPEQHLSARMAHGPNSELYTQVVEVTRSLLQHMERTGVATANEVGIDSLAERIEAEVLALDATLVSPAYIGAWTIKPAYN